ncbi:MAG: FmdB family transcriptional regulator [Planctomycetota bacterium]|nr:MAG: FmdB family transcriptional regulator [Planctomycetota bacterium]
MPNYEYECGHCNHKFIEFQTMSEDRLVKCPECKKNKLERLISGGGGIVFKGSGFYETDYKKVKKENPSETKETPAKKDDASVSTKSDDTKKSSASTVKKEKPTKSSD